MSRVSLVSFCVLLSAVIAYGSPSGPSIAINFAAEEPEGAFEGEVTGAAGVLGTVNWNNFEGNISFDVESLTKDVNGAVQNSGATVEWVSNNTWASDGRGNEDLNDADDGDDRALMLGYLDTNADDPAEVEVTGIDADIATGFDVYVYILGGVLDRGGDYTVEAGVEITLPNIQLEIFEGEFIEGEEGNYLLFEGLSGDTMRLEAQPTTGATRRAPVNAIEIVGQAGGAGLQAGDADQDLDFDQLDLVKVQIAAKYLTGQNATWGEGDWNGAPGGSQGSPPAGDSSFNQLDIIAALSPGHYLTGPYAAINQGGTIGDEQTTLVYDAGTGELSVDSPASTDLTSINIDSAGGKFIGEKPSVLDGAFDNFSADNIFKATFGGSFGDITFGNVLPTGLSEVDVATDLTAVGSLAGGGDLGAVDLVYIPEPTTMLLFALGLIGISSVRRRRR